MEVTKTYRIINCILLAIRPLAEAGWPESGEDLMAVILSFGASRAFGNIPITEAEVREVLALRLLDLIPEGKV